MARSQLASLFVLVVGLALLQVKQAEGGKTTVSVASDAIIIGAGISGIAAARRHVLARTTDLT